MVKFIKRFILAIVLLFTVVLVIFIGLYAFTPVIDNLILHNVNRFLPEDANLKYSKLSGNLLSTIVLEDPVYQMGENTFGAEKIALDYQLSGVFRNRYYVSAAKIENPKVNYTLTSDENAKSTPIDSLLAAFTLAEFPTVSVQNFSIVNAEIIINAETEVFVFNEINTSLTLALNTEEFSIEPENFSGNWQNKSLKIHQLNFDLSGTDSTAQLQNVQLDATDLSAALSISAKIKPQLSWELDLQSIETSDKLIEKFTEEFPYENAKISLRGNAIGDLQNAEGNIFATATLDDLSINKLNGGFVYNDSKMAFQELDLNTNFGQVVGSGAIYPNRQNALNLRFSNVNLAPLKITDVPTNLNGALQMQFFGDALENISGSGKLILKDFVYDSLKVDSLQLQLAATNGNWQINQPSKVKVGEGSEFTIGGTLSREQELDVVLNTDYNDLGVLAEQLQLGEVDGAGSMELKLFGQLEDPSISGYVFFDSLMYEKSIIYGIDGEIELANLLTTRQGEFGLELATGYIGNVFLTSGEVEMVIDQNKISFDPFKFYSEENSIQTVGNIEFSDNKISLFLDSLALTYERYKIANAEPVRLYLQDNDSLVIERFLLTGDSSGLLTAEGHLSLDKTEKSELLILLENIRIAPLNEYLAWNRQMRGFLNGEMDLFGELNNPEIDLQISIEAFAIDENELGRATGDFSIADKRLSINVVSFEGNNDFYFDINGSVDINLGEKVTDNEMEIAGDVPLGMNVVFGNLRLQDYDFLYETTVPVEGAITGRLDIGGSLQKPNMQLDLEGKQLVYAEYEAPSLKMLATLNDKKIVISEANVNFLDTEVEFDGYKTINWNPDALDSLFTEKYLELRFNIDEDSLNFLSAINPQLDRLIGKTKVNGVIKGNYDAPTVDSLNATVENAKLYLATIENYIDISSASAILDENKRLQTRVVGKSPKPKDSGSFLQRIFRKLTGWIWSEPERGDILVNGWIDLNNALRPTVKLTASLDDAYFNYFLENTRVVVDAKNIEISGRDTIVVSGDIAIVEGEVEFDFIESEKNLLFETTLREEPPFVTYNLDIEMLQNFVIRSTETLNNFEMNLTGDIRVLSQPRSELEIYGDLNTTGSYFVQGENFEILSGKISFINPKELPELNLSARTYKQDVVRNTQLTFLLNVFGSIDSPEKEIVIQDAQGNTLNYEVKDQLALLLFGTTFDQLGSTDAQDLLLSRGEQVLTQALVSSIEKEARNFTGLDNIKLDQQDSFFSNRLNRPSTLSLGKYLTPNLYLEYRSQLASSGLGNVPAPQLSWEAGNQLYLQYRLNRKWSFSTIYQKTSEGNDKVQFDINWQTGF